MAFGHGKNTVVYVNQYNLTTYFRSATASGSADTAETSTFGTSSKTYIPGMKDGTASLEGLYDGVASAVDDVLTTALGAASDSVVSIYPQGDAQGAAGFAASGIESSYEVTAATEDAVMVSAEVQSTSGYDRVLSHKPLAQVSGNGNGTGIDYGSVSSLFGGVGYVHVTQHSGAATLTVKVQDSADNAAFADILTFTAGTVVTKERVALGATATVRRYTRALWTLASGTATFQVGFHRRVQ